VGRGALRRSLARQFGRVTPQPALPPRVTRALLSACFFATGGTGLIYEVLWSRYLQLLFGSTTEAVSVVLAVFMTGLGLGAHVLGRRIDTSRSPLRAYGLLEISVGAYALLTGPLLGAVRFLYAQAASRAELGSLAGTFLKLALSAAVLLLPGRAESAPGGPRDRPKRAACGCRLRRRTARSCRSGCGGGGAAARGGRGGV